MFHESGLTSAARSLGRNDVGLPRRCASDGGRHVCPPPGRPRPENRRNGVRWQPRAPAGTVHGWKAHVIPIGERAGTADSERGIIRPALKGCACAGSRGLSHRTTQPCP
ncbi:hypothetical protein GDI2807 [Gluconacetobacter diazotrophicus PA1 5]|uniref:Uncharacterized protein n=1 Tax=Gluconacetobacter diazotrophicus (strain ATCC 49037 / DSM 5601 / CCUG 37298 / CIP 103539 / LMG 7603 / PAl5) TaxID=272568 RepID=A9HQJ0_GLUDA|nr:hypothetical protein GDI2807 [Gluconacetobacter diazotrophicus PA1 5]